MYTNKKGSGTYSKTYLTEDNIFESNIVGDTLRPSYNYNSRDGYSEVKMYGYNSNTEVYEKNSASYSTEKDSVFAGYVVDGKTISNRSYWTVAKNNGIRIDFCLASHWAGSEFGGELA